MNGRLIYDKPILVTKLAQTTIDYTLHHPTSGALETEVVLGVEYKKLPVIGAFWDLENCQVPKGISASALVHKIRKDMFHNHREAEFIVVCDTLKENKVIIQELNDANVSIVNVSATAKNAADDKIKFLMKRFIDFHSSPATLLLLTSDVNFSSDLSYIRYTHNYRVILIHHPHVNSSLVAYAHESYLLSNIADSLPLRNPKRSPNNQPCKLSVSGLSINHWKTEVKRCLQKIFSNCGGKVVNVSGSRATILFKSYDAAKTAENRMNNVEVLGKKITVRSTTAEVEVYEKLAQTVDYSGSSIDTAPVKLYISNLDCRFEISEMKKILSSVFTKHVEILSLDMSAEDDNTVATITVSSLQDAEYAVSKFHRRLIGEKKINVSYLYSERNPGAMKSTDVSKSTKINDVSIHEDSDSQPIDFTKDSTTPLLPNSENVQECTVIDSQIGDEEYNISSLPIVSVSLKQFAYGVHMLLDSHQGSLPLVSFIDCYEAEVATLPIISNMKDSTSDDGNPGVGNMDPTNPKGVPLEHLIACVAGVEVRKCAQGIKNVQWLGNKESQFAEYCNAALEHHLSLFIKEVQELLINRSHCLLAVNSVFLEYNRHFGRKCNFAEYGFKKLIDLLQTIPHVFQILGTDENSQVTLTHHTQVKRFSEELLRILKSRGSKRIPILEIPKVYEQVLGRHFDITNYGLCCLKDMLKELPESLFFIFETEGIVGIPIREQTATEEVKFEEFAVEVSELLKKFTPDGMMPLKKFTTNYQQYFRKNFRVADYGFKKVLEMVEALPDILEVQGTSKEIILKLVPKEQLEINKNIASLTPLFRLTRNIIFLLQDNRGQVLLSNFESLYHEKYGAPIHSPNYGFNDLPALIKRLPDYFLIKTEQQQLYVCLKEQNIVLPGDSSVGNDGVQESSPPLKKRKHM